MTNNMNLIPLLVLMGSVAATSVFVLLHACDGITCAFGPLDSENDGHREARRMGQTCNFQRHDTDDVQRFDQTADNVYFRQKILSS